MRCRVAAALLLGIAFVCAAQDFEITAIEKDGTIRWQGLAGHVYTVQSCDGLGEPWEIVSPKYQWPIEVPAWLVDGLRGWPPGIQRFYRIMAVRPPEGMVSVPGGTFTMGDATDHGDWGGFELPLHEVLISTIYVAKVEVTKAEWDEVYTWAAANGYSFESAGSGKAWNHPVHTVSWYDAVKWCNARSEMEGLTSCYYVSPAQIEVYRVGQLDVGNDQVRWEANGYRLPTEAEWEYAARGGVAGRRFPWSDADTISHSQANYYSYWVGGRPVYSYDVSPTEGWHPDYATGDGPYTSPVGSFPPNDFGLHDMAGNVSEWCWDWYAGSYYNSSPASNPRGPDVGENRVCRDGNCYFYAPYSRVARRGLKPPGFSSDILGFRVVRRLP